MAANFIAIIVAVGMGRRHFPMSTPKSPVPGPAEHKRLAETIDRVKLLEDADCIIDCYVATSSSLKEKIKQQAGRSATVVTVPDGVGSLAAMLHLAHLVGATDETPVVMLPSDQQIDDPEVFAANLNSACHQAPNDKFTYLLTPLTDAPLPRFSYCQLPCGASQREIHSVRQLIGRPSSDELGKIEAGADWHVNTGVVIAWGKTWKQLESELFHEVVAAGPQEENRWLAAGLDDRLALRPERLAGWIGDYHWRNLGMTDDGQATSKGAFVSDDPQAAPLVINEMDDHLVVLDAELADDVAVLVGNHITCVTPRNELDRVESLLDAVASSPYSKFVSDPDDRAKTRRPR